MNQVVLRTKEKKRVAEVQTPIMNPMPEMIMWGQRFFTRDERRAGTPVTEPHFYTEGLCYAVPIGQKDE